MPEQKLKYFTFEGHEGTVNGHRMVKWQGQTFHFGSVMGPMRKAIEAAQEKGHE